MLKRALLFIICAIIVLTIASMSKLLGFIYRQALERAWGTRKRVLLEEDTTLRGRK